MTSKSRPIARWLQYYINEIFLLNYSSSDACRAAVAGEVTNTAGGVAAAYLTQISRRAVNLKLVLFFAPLFIVLLICFRLLVFPSATPTAKEFGLNLCAVAYIFIIFRVTFIKYYFQAKEVLSATRRLILRDHAIEEGKRLSLEERTPGIRLSSLSDGRPALKTDSLIEESGRKGALTMLLLDQLIRKECDRPNIFNGSLETTSNFYIQLMNCQRKYFLNKAKSYRKRETIVINSENARSTHLKYLTMIIEHYGAIEDDQLHYQAEDLKSFILKK